MPFWEDLIQPQLCSTVFVQEFHSASNLASKIIILDKNGQPRSEKTVDGDEEEIQEALLQADQLIQSDLVRRQSESARDQLSIIPLTNLLPGTNYTFEWSSANQFHLTTTLQFVTATTPLTAPNKPTVGVLAFTCWLGYVFYWSGWVTKTTLKYRDYDFTQRKIRAYGMENGIDHKVGS